MATRTAHGGSLPRNWSDSTELTASLGALHALLLVALGFLAVALHASFHWPLKLPGHHGLEWMALMMFGRCASRYRLAATVIATGAAVASLLPIWHFTEPLVWLFYLLPGIVVDVLFALAAAWRDWVLILGVIAAVAHATKPLARWVLAEALGWPLKSLVAGLAFPLAAHLIFGLVGGIAGALAWRVIHARR